MNSRRRVNAALVGLLVLVLAAWLVRAEFTQHSAPTPPHPPAVRTTH